MPMDTDLLASLYNGGAAQPREPIKEQQIPTQLPQESTSPNESEHTQPQQLLLLPITQLSDFPQSRYNRYQIHKGEKMEELVRSIRLNGILQPLVVRMLPQGGYQVVDGRNRREAARKAGYDTVPCLLRELDDTDALRQLNYLNARYRQLRPSEKAYAYQLEYEQSEHQGFRTDLVNSSLFRDETKLNDETQQDSRTTKWRYRQLTRLVPDGLLDAADEELISLQIAVELAALSEENQRNVCDFFFDTRCESICWLDSQRTITGAIIKQINQLVQTHGTLSAQLLESLFDEDVQEEKKYSYSHAKLNMKPLRKRYPDIEQMDEKEFERLVLDALDRYFQLIGTI